MNFGISSHATDMVLVRGVKMQTTQRFLNACRNLKRKPRCNQCEQKKKAVILKMNMKNKQDWLFSGGAEVYIILGSLGSYSL